MGRYVPPELEGVASFNQASGKKPNSRNADGSQTVRFECPFAIWCTTCKPEAIIGQGVRFNAHKKQAGKYLSTPIWSFRFKHTICGGWIEVRTDPKNTEYVITEGGRRRDYGEAKIDFEVEGVGTAPDPPGGIEDVLGRVEKKAGDKQAADAQRIRVEELRKRAERDWADPYEMNKKIRKDFRVGRRARDDSRKTGEAIQDKFGLGLDVMPANEMDAQRAKMVDFGSDKQEDVIKSGLFQERVAKKKLTTGKSALQTSLQGNTRLTSDPFIRVAGPWQGPKARRYESTQDEKRETKLENSTAISGLIDYDSD